MADERIWQQEGRSVERDTEDRSTQQTGSPVTGSPVTGSPVTGATEKRTTEKRATDSGSVSSRAREDASRMAEEARQRGKGFMEEQKRAAADSLSRFSGVLHDTATRLDEDQPVFSRMFHDGASALDRFGETLRERDTEGLIHEAQDFARRQPALMLGGAVAAGFFLSRILKSSSSRSPSEYAGERFRESRDFSEERTSSGIYTNPYSQENQEFSTPSPRSGNGGMKSSGMSDWEKSSGQSERSDNILLTTREEEPHA